MKPCFSETDLPDLYTDANRESLRGQKLYLLCFKLLICSTLLAAFAAWLATDFNIRKLFWNLIAAASMIVAVTVTSVIADRGFEKSWYAGRAIAESVKSLSWLYMMCAEAYPRVLSYEDAVSRFIADQKRIITERGPVVISRMPSDGAGAISMSMQDIRRLPFESRLEIYLQFRVNDQKIWYGRKAAISSRMEKRAFMCLQLSQVVSLLIALVSIFRHEVASGSIGVLGVLSGAVVSWLQVKRYQETAQSYALTYQELSLIEAQGTMIASEERLAVFVQDAETAISREHTLWLARRVLR